MIEEVIARLRVDMGNEKARRESLANQIHFLNEVAIRKSKYELLSEKKIQEGEQLADYLFYYLPKTSQGLIIRADEKGTLLTYHGNIQREDFIKQANVTVELIENKNNAKEKEKNIHVRNSLKDLFSSIKEYFSTRREYKKK